MIRINKNLVTFLGLMLLLGASFLFALQKLSPLISRAVYYCQSFISSLSLPVSYYLSILPFLFVLVALLIVGLRLSAIYIKVRFLRKKLIANVQPNESLSKLLGKLALVNKTCLIADEKHFAFCLGVRNPKIYVSTGLVGLLTIEELETVLRHEQHHLKNRDTLIMLVASIGQSLLPFFPLLSDFLHNYKIEREIQADKAAIQGLGSQKPLVSVLKKFLNSPSAAMVSVTAIADHETLEPRIHALVKKDFRFRTFKIKHIFISLFSVLIMSVLTLAPVQAVEIRNMEERGIMVCPRNYACPDSCRQKYSIDSKNYSEDVRYSPTQ